MKSYLPSTLKQLQYYKSLAERAMRQVPEEKLFYMYNDDSNSIAVIVKHLWGNMLSRFTDFMTSDGEKEWRERDAEFENDLKDVNELWEKWEAGWKVVFEAVEPLKEEDLEKWVYIRNEGHTVIEALNRQMAHYAYHVGQIVYRCKMLTPEPWQSLTIPRGESKSFNAKKFSQEKGRGHFTDNVSGK